MCISVKQCPYNVYTHRMSLIEQPCVAFLRSTVLPVCFPFPLPAFRSPRHRGATPVPWRAAGPPPTCASILWPRGLVSQYLCAPVEDSGPLDEHGTSNQSLNVWPFLPFHRGPSTNRGHLHLLLWPRTWVFGSFQGSFVAFKDRVCPSLNTDSIIQNCGQSNALNSLQKGGSRRWKSASPNRWIERKKKNNGYGRLQSSRLL